MQCWTSQTPSGWGEWDDDNWVDGVLWCLRGVGDFVQINNSPPKKCPYYLEHVISNAE